MKKSAESPAGSAQDNTREENLWWFICLPQKPSLLVQHQNNQNCNRHCLEVFHSVKLLQWPKRSLHIVVLASLVQSSDPSKSRIKTGYLALCGCQIDFYQTNDLCNRWRNWLIWRNTTLDESLTSNLSFWIWAIEISVDSNDRLISFNLSCWTHWTYWQKSVHCVSHTGSQLTSSTESFMMYLVTFTSLVCPILWIRSTAWASAIGFHWGSTRCTQLATVKSILYVSDQLRSHSGFSVEIDVPFTSTTNTCKHHRAFWIFVELGERSTPCRKTWFTVYPLKTKSVRFKSLLDQIEHLCPVAEYHTVLY